MFTTIVSEQKTHKAFIPLNELGGSRNLFQRFRLQRIESAECGSTGTVGDRNGGLIRRHSQKRGPALQMELAECPPPSHATALARHRGKRQVRRGYASVARQRFFDGLSSVLFLQLTNTGSLFGSL